jgi:GDPmannose 4,6-dehydratase
MKALITGISGQDGSYLSEYLLDLGYEVHGIVQRVELEDPERQLWRLLPFMDKLCLHPASIESFPSLLKAIEEIQPDECYHLAAQSFVSYSFDDEFSVFNVNIGGTHNLLSAIKASCPTCRFYFASSSEMFGRAQSSPQNEETPFHPRSAYGITKLTGFHLTTNYRENYDLFACSGILFNHESIRRGSEYVTRKISQGAARIKLGLAQELQLGNLDSVRDWGYAPDYIRAMWLMLQQDQPDDYVIATGQTHSVRDLCKTAFSYLDLDYAKVVKTDPKYYRPAESIPLVGDPSKARKVLGWKSQKSFTEMIEEMVRFDLNRLKSHS